MLTVVETLLFQKQWPHYWTEQERDQFVNYIAEFPTAGDVVADSGGVRVIYFTHSDECQIVLLTLYAKTSTNNLNAARLKEIRHALQKKTS